MEGLTGNNHVAGDDLEVRVRSFEMRHHVELIDAVALTGVDDQDVDAGSDEGRGALAVVRSGADGSTDEELLVGVLAGEREVAVLLQIGSLLAVGGGDYRNSPKWSFVGMTRQQKGRSTPLAQLFKPLMPDGGVSPCVIKVVRVGGGGSNAVDRMMDTRVASVEFWAVNTDAQALGRSKTKGASVLNIGQTVTRGIGAGGDPRVGEDAAHESREEIRAMVEGSDLVFVTLGMGGGTGSGAAPVVSKISNTKPFLFEGSRRMRQATDAIARLREAVDTVIVVSNNKLLEIIPDNTPLEASFAVADDILRQGVVGISEIIVRPGLINVDFADASTLSPAASS